MIYNLIILILELNSHLIIIFKYMLIYIFNCINGAENFYVEISLILLK